VPTKLSRFTVNIPETLAKAVEELARQDERSVSKYIAMVIQRHVDEVNMNGGAPEPRENTASK